MFDCCMADSSADAPSIAHADAVTGAGMKPAIESSSDLGTSSGGTSPAIDRVRAALCARADAHGGVPVGVLLLSKQHVAALHRLLLRWKLKFLGVETEAFGEPLPPVLLRTVHLRAYCCCYCYTTVCAPHMQTKSEYCVGPAVPLPLLEQPLRLLHLPPAVVLAIEMQIDQDAAGDGDGNGISSDGDGESLADVLAAFIADTGGIFFSGVRRSDALFGRAPCFPRPGAGRFTFAEAFAGIGGFRLGLEAIGGQCVMASEIDKPATATYRANWPVATGAAGDPMVGDIMSVYAADLPSFDILTAGFPCQPFSVRGGGQRGAPLPHRQSGRS